MHAPPVYLDDWSEAAMQKGPRARRLCRAEPRSGSCAVGQASVPAILGVAQGCLEARDILAGRASRPSISTVARLSPGRRGSRRFAESCDGARQARAAPNHRTRLRRAHGRPAQQRASMAWLRRTMARTSRAMDQGSANSPLAPQRAPSGTSTLNHSLARRCQQRATRRSSCAAAVPWRHE